MVNLTPDQQAEVVREHPAAFQPESDAWGRQSCTSVWLARVDHDTLGAALTLAWQHLARARFARKPPRSGPATIDEYLTKVAPDKRRALEGTETLNVRLDLDTEMREVHPPAELVKALKAAPPAWERWRELSVTHQREYVEAFEGAKKPETRQRRLAAAVEAVRARPPRRSTAGPGSGRS